MLNNYPNPQLQKHMASIKRVHRFSCGSKLLIFTDGRRKYLPSPEYNAFAAEMKRKFQIKRTDTSTNCSRLFDKIFGCLAEQPRSCERLVGVS